MAEKERCHLCLDFMGEWDRSICRRCKSDPFPNDTRLRKRGWRVVRRPRSYEATWTDGRRIVPLSVALDLIER